jgi:hypothetical protein
MVIFTGFFTRFVRHSRFDPTHCARSAAAFDAKCVTLPSRPGLFEDMWVLSPTSAGNDAAPTAKRCRVADWLARTDQEGAPSWVSICCC